LLSNLVAKENHLLAHNITPTVAVCGAGAAGVELAFGYK
jgi:NADH dehydrogenase FAD-containing subunit